MSRARPGLVSELLPVFLIVLAVGGSLGLVLAMHERAAARSREALATPAPVAPKPAPPPPVAVIAPPPAPKYVKKPKPKPEAPVEDPTKPILAALAAEAAKERDAAREADRTAEAFETARQAASAESERWRRREALARAQVNTLADEAGTIEAEADGLAAERDVLARQKDFAKADLAQSLARAGGYAVLPNKGAHGTWQRPVMIECKNGVAILQPRNIAFTMVDMSPTLGLRGNPLVAAVARELIKVQNTTSPDGAPVVPYIYFLVRPDGIRSYYEARGRLEMLGIAFGYELVDQDWKVEFPDFDALESWDGLKPLRSSLPSLALESAPGSGGRGHGIGNGNGNGNGNGLGSGGAQGNAFVWPVDRPGGVRGNGNGDGDGSGTGLGHGNGGPGGDSPFVWPTQPPGGLADGSGGMGGPDSSTPGSGQFRAAPSQPPSRGGGAIFAPGYGGGARPGGSGTGGSIDLGSLTPPGPGVDMGVRRGTTALPQMVGDPRNRGLAPGWSGGGGGGTAPSTAPGSPGLSGGGTGGTPGIGGTPGSSLVAGSGSSTPRALSGSPGLTPVDPSQLPGLTSADGNGNGNGVANAGAAGSGAPPLTSAPPAGSTGLRPPPNRVRIDPKLLAYADEGQQILDQYHQNDPADGQASGNSPNGDPATGSAGAGARSDPNGGGSRQGSGSPSGKPGSSSNSAGAPATGLGQTSASGGQSSGTVGVGMPSIGGMTNGGGGADASSSSSSSSSSDTHPKPSTGSPGGTPRSIFDRTTTRTVEVTLPLVVACGPSGVTIHPGGYRLSSKTLAQPGMLVRDLRTIVQNHALIDASIRPRPRLEFLVEPGGSQTYAEARRQTVLSGLPWPVTLRVAEASIARTFPKERF